MDCQQVGDLLDAYALGALGKADAAPLEEHVADCVRCWEELTKAQQTAAMLALSIPMERPPASLGEEILARARRERAARSRVPGFLRRVRLGWPAAAALSAAGAAALVFAAFLQFQMNDLRDEKDDLAREVHVASRQLDDQAQILTVATASDLRRIPMRPVSSDAWGEYHWSPSTGKGFIVCYHMPPLQQDEVYQAWFSTDSDPVSAGTFAPQDGTCQYLMEPAVTNFQPTGVGVSREKSGGSAKPSGTWLIFASIER